MDSQRGLGEGTHVRVRPIERPFPKWEGEAPAEPRSGYVRLSKSGCCRYSAADS